MKKLDKQPEEYFRKLIGLLEKESSYISIQKPGLMRFVVEPIGNLRENGLPEAKLWSMAFYGRLNGDAMRDPEMCFAETENGIYPYMFQNDYVGAFHQMDLCGWYAETPVQNSMASFANMWMRALSGYEMHTGPIEQHK